MGTPLNNQLKQKPRKIWRWIRRLAFILASLVTLVVLFYSVENWRGQRAWEKYKKELEAKGEKLDLAAFIPPPVPDEQNFAMTPLFKPLFDYDGTSPNIRYRDTNAVARLQSIGPYQKGKNSGQETFGDWAVGKRINLKTWQDYYRSSTDFSMTNQPQTPARDVLLALSKYDVELSEIVEGSRRPYARFPIYPEKASYAYFGDNQSTQHLLVQMNFGKLLELHAIANLELGESEQAMQDILACLRLRESVCKEPFLMSHIIGSSLEWMALQIIWEGIADRCWTETQLKTFEAELGGIDLLTNFVYVLRYERAQFNNVLSSFAAIGPVEGLRRYLDQRYKVDEDSLEGSLLVYNLVPRRRCYQNLIWGNQYFQEKILPRIDIEKQRLDVNGYKQGEDFLDTFHPTPNNVLAWVFLLITTEGSQRPIRFAFNQTSINEARIACALERYRLAYGKLPDQLKALVPQFIEKLPHDVITGDPLKYRLRGDGQFILYSVGWNQKDDGGVVEIKKGEQGSQDLTRGDWVWQYPLAETKNLK